MRELSRLIAIVTMLVVTAGGVAETLRLELPLEDGRLAMRDVVRGLSNVAGIPLPRALVDASGSIDVSSRLGRSQIAMIERLSGGAATVEVADDHAALLIDRDMMEDRARGARTSVEQWLEGVAEHYARVSAEQRHYGITFITDEDPREPLETYARDHASMPERVVILIHGLDDPGWMWRDMIPALRDAGHVVARMEYPNDEAIADATDLFAAELRALRAAGVQRVDVVAHSMGGLVTRDVLTRRAYYGGNGDGEGDGAGDGDGAGAGGDALPAVDRFIMCGTPNHGSVMVRLRAVSELQEQLSRAFSGEGSWLGGMDDGRGEAAVDLLPDSDFLRRLNRRPLATHTQHTNIVGRMSPVDAADLAALGDRLRSVAVRTRAPSWLRRLIDTAESETADVLDAAERELGDGCVTVESARLKGVEDTVLIEANHVSMIVNVSPASKATPPAIPIVLERLE